MNDEGKFIVNIKEKFNKIDFVILITMTLLILIGLFSVRQAYLLDSDLNKILIKQLVGIVIGYVLVFLIIFIDYHIIYRFSPVLYIAINLILAYTLLFGSNINGVKRWMIISGTPVQPSEITKVVLILFLACSCNYYKDKLNKLYVILILLVVVAIPTLLILLEPHLSSSISLLFISVIIIYSSGIGYKIIGKVLALAIPAVFIILISVFLFKVNIPFIENYQTSRITKFLSDDESENLSGNYQQNQSLAAIAKGGLHGEILTDKVSDSEKKYSNIYAKESDFVFAIVGEEFGFIGCFIIILLYGILIIRCIVISARTSDYIGKLICMGVSALFMFQFFVNIGVATGLIPNTGLPLPFISSGLTSFLSSAIAVGLVLNINLRTKDNSTKR